ncbi:DUF1127 domain-containing protein [Roseobacter sp.]|uniref:DUF1127 domain-containing protein n=1 Tax=Roseobacter sp. TaxID=1907202 RepID=UPI003297EEA4
MTYINSASCPCAPSVPRRRPGLSSYLALWRSRRALAQLDAKALDDVGLDPATAEREARRMFWDVPQTWTNR